MVKTAPIAKTIISLSDLENRFGLRSAKTDDFFTEWHQNLPAITDHDCEQLDRIHGRFLRHRKHQVLAEGTVNQLLVSPLLTLAGLFDEPFYVTNEPTIQIEVEGKDEVLRGRIDTLILRDRLWIVVVESKDSLSFSLGLPQALAYMMANPNPERPVFGMVTSGDEFIFIKVATKDFPIYDLSNVFYLLLPRRNPLIDVFQILSQLKFICTN